MYSKIYMVRAGHGRHRALHFDVLGFNLVGSGYYIVLAYSYRFKIEVSFKVLKHLMGAFFYRFWTSAWPHIGKRTASDLPMITDSRRQRLIQQTTNAIEAFGNFGCIATGILQIIALSFHEKIWRQYAG